jgi:hypothetical protein
VLKQLAVEKEFPGFSLAPTKAAREPTETIIDKARMAAPTMIGSPKNDGLPAPGIYVYLRLEPRVVSLD